MAFRVGQKVVTVAAPWHSLGSACPWLAPDLNAVLTVRSIVPWDNGRGYSLRFNEIKNKFINGFEPAFSAVYFRPVQTTDTGMAILEQIRRDVTNKELHPICHDEQF